MNDNFTDALNEYRAKLEAMTDAEFWESYRREFGFPDFSAGRKNMTERLVLKLKADLERS